MNEEEEVDDDYDDDDDDDDDDAEADVLARAVSSVLPFRSIIKFKIGQVDLR